MKWMVCIVMMLMTTAVQGGKAITRIHHTVWSKNDFALEIHILTDNEDFGGGTALISWPKGTFFNDKEFQIAPMNAGDPIQKHRVTFLHLAPDKSSTKPSWFQVSLSPPKNFSVPSYTHTIKDPDFSEFGGNLTAILGPQSAGKTLSIVMINKLCNRGEYREIGVFGTSTDPTTRDISLISTPCGDFYDTVGSNLQTNISKHVVRQILRGEFASGSKLESSGNLHRDATRMAGRMTGRKVDRVLFFVNAENVGQQNSSWVSYWQAVADVAAIEKIPTSVVVTHIDIIHPEVLTVADAIFDPKGASQQCYRTVARQTGNSNIRLIALPQTAHHEELDNINLVLPLSLLVHDVLPKKYPTPKNMDVFKIVLLMVLIFPLLMRYAPDHFLLNLVSWRAYTVAVTGIVLYSAFEMFWK